MDQLPRDGVDEGRAQSNPPVRWSYDLTFFRRAYVRLHRALQRWFKFRLYLVQFRPILVDELAFGDVAADYEFLEPAQEQVVLSMEDPALSSTAQFARESYRRGDRCFVAVNQGDFVGYYWASASGAVPLTEDLSFLFQPSRGVYCPLMLIHPRCRGRGLYQQLVAYGDRALLASGHSHVVGCVESQNFSSRRALSRIPGIQLVGMVGALCVFGRIVTFRSWGARRRGYAVGAALSHEDESGAAAASVADCPDQSTKGSRSVNDQAKL